MDRQTALAKISPLIPKDRLVTDPEVLKRLSMDRFRKYAEIFDAFPLPAPVALVYASDTREIAALLAACNENGINVIPKTGGSSIEGGLENGAEISIVVDASNMNQILNIDTYNMMVTCQCGVCLETLETKLREMGYTTGHSPQSKPLAQMGGLAATRSIGQFSTLYGGIEDMVVGLEMVLPNGQIARIKNVPRRAAGPDIRHIAIGSEGALCFITEVTVKIFKHQPENNRFFCWLMDDMKTGFEILRQVMVEGYKPSFARLYDFEDGEYYFSHFCEGKPVLIFMTEGPAEISRVTGEAIERIVAGYGNFQRIDSQYIEAWYAKLNWDASSVEKERREILETKNLGFTTEISANWSDIHAIYEVCVRRIRDEIPDITMIGGHSSHSYINGTNLYFMYYYNVNCPPGEEITKYHYPINRIIVEESLRLGGSMVHHHGVGKHRVPWIEQEHGTSYPVLKALKNTFDPKGIMNRGTVFPG